MKYIKKLIIFVVLLSNYDISAQAYTCVNAPTNYSNFISGGIQPYRLSNGDLNGDGFTDVVATYANSNNVGVFMGNGTGNFTLSALYPVGTTPYSVVINDFNNDTKPDLAVCNFNSQNISILNGLGSGLFGTATNYSVGTSASEIYSNDFNGDNFADLCIIAGLTIQISLNNGSGGFPSAVSYTFGVNPLSATIGNFNNDTNPDILVTYPTSNNVVLFAGSPSGTFVISNIINITGTPWQITSEDYNGDTFKDFAVFCSTTKDLRIYNGNGTGAFTLFTSMICDPVATQIASADVNNDGHKDILTCGGEHFQIFKGQGNGNFLAPLVYSAGYSTSLFTCGQFNNDGFIDVVVATGPQINRLITIFNSGNGEFKDTRSYLASTTSTGFLHTVGDFNNDGLKDLAATDSNLGTISILLNTGNNDFIPGITFSVEPTVYDLQALDLNQDNNLDLFVPVGNGNVRIFYGSGLGTFSLASSYYSNVQNSKTYTLNLNNDNLIDIAYINTNGLVALVNNGNGTFGGSALYTSQIPSSIASGDFDNDGYNDIVIAPQSSSNPYFVFINTGMGNSFSAPATFTTSNPASFPTAGDYDNDGNCDLAFATYAGIEIQKGDGLGNFTPFAFYPHTMGSNGELKTLDFNGDQKLDIVMNNTYELVSVLTGNNNGTFNAWTHILTTGNQKIDIADMNNDNALDITTSNGEISVIFGGMLPLSIAGPNSICSGAAPITLTTSGVPGTFTWSTGSNSSIINVQPLVTTTYSIIATGLFGCNNTSNQKTVTVVPSPTLTLSSTNSIICSGNSATINCSGANSYTWSTGFFTPSVSVSPTITTTYSVTGKDLNNCVNTVTYTQIVSICTGIKENLQNSFSIFPNPNAGIFSISISENCELEIYNTLGQLIYSKVLTENLNKIELPYLSNGIYYTKIKNSTIEYSTKIIINK